VGFQDRYSIGVDAGHQLVTIPISSIGVVFRFRNFLVAPSDRFKSFSPSRVWWGIAVLVAGSSVRTLKTPFAASF
jgi:hypothetical protein